MGGELGVGFIVVMVLVGFFLAGWAGGLVMLVAMVIANVAPPYEQEHDPDPPPSPK